MPSVLVIESVFRQGELVYCSSGVFGFSSTIVRLSSTNFVQDYYPWRYSMSGQSSSSTFSVGRVFSYGLTIVTRSWSSYGGSKGHDLQRNINFSAFCLWLNNYYFFGCRPRHIWVVYLVSLWVMSGGSSCVGSYLKLSWRYLQGQLEFL